MSVRFKIQIHPIKLRRNTLRHLLLFCLAGLLLTASCAAGDPLDEVMFGQTKLLTLVNKARQSGHYCGTKWYPPTGKVVWNDKLEAAAKEHSIDMYENNFFNHKGSNGRFVADRLYSQHYFWKAAGENVAYGMLYEDEMMNELLNSEGHCVTIMNPVFTEMGAWLTGLYWTQVFAQPQ